MITGFDTPIGGDFRVMLCFARACALLGHETYILMERTSSVDEFEDEGIQFVYYDRMSFEKPALPEFDLILTHMNHISSQVIPALSYTPRVVYFSTGFPDDPNHDPHAAEQVLTYHHPSRVQMKEAGINADLFLHYIPDLTPAPTRDIHRVIYASTELYSANRPEQVLEIFRQARATDDRFQLAFYFVPIWLDGAIDSYERMIAEPEHLMTPGDWEHRRVAHSVLASIENGVDGVEFIPFTGWTDFQRSLASSGIFLSAKDGNFSMTFLEAAAHGTIPIGPETQYLANRWFNHVAWDGHEDEFLTRIATMVVESVERHPAMSSMVREDIPMVMSEDAFLNRVKEVLSE
jgi:hypothetical protein